MHLVPPRSLRRRFAAFLFIGCAAAIFAEPASAKVRAAPFTPNAGRAPHTRQHERQQITPAFVAAFEARLRPYFESRRQGRAAIRRLPASRFPSESDFLLLASLSNSLSPSFKTLYKSVVAIPAGDTFYISPGGHFAVYYSTDSTSMDYVPPIDTIHFDTGLDWRTEIAAPNGVPDYVDQVAFACDSAWSMEINRFQFNHPVSLIDSATVSPYITVHITYLGPGYYGKSAPGRPYPRRRERVRRPSGAAERLERL